MTEENSWTVAFAGPGMVTEANVSGLLNNWLPDELDLILPAKITRAQKGLGNVASYITRNYGDSGNDGFETRPVNHIVGALAEAKAKGDAVYLVLLWGEDGDDASMDMLEDATQREIQVLDLTQGLEDITFEPNGADLEEETAAEHPADGSESHAEGRTHRRRGESTPPPAKDVRERPSRTRGKPRGKDPTEGTEAATDPAASVDKAFADAEPIRLEAMAALLDERIRLSMVKVLQAMLEALGEKRPVGRPRLVPEGQETTTWWKSEDGSFHKRKPGRIPRGVTVVQLTANEVEKLGLTDDD